jgi:hypothetical protein
MMTKDQIKVFRDKLIEACDKHIAAGNPIVLGVFVHNSCLCPLAILAGKDAAIDVLAPHITDDIAQNITKQLGFHVSDVDVWSFIDGFDDMLLAPEDQLVELGRELRQKYDAHITA